MQQRWLGKSHKVGTIQAIAAASHRGYFLALRGSLYAHNYPPLRNLMSDLLSYFQDQQQAMIDLLTTLCNFETPTRGKEHVDKMGAFMEAQFRELGTSSVTRIAQTEVGDLLLAKWNENASGQPITFLIHIDTVWP